MPLSNVAAVLWREWHAARGRPTRLGRRQVVAIGAPITVVWRATGPQTAALAIPPAVLQAWTARVSDTTMNTGDRLGLVAPDGHLLAGVARAGDATAIRLPASDSGLPWTLVVTRAIRRR